MIIEMASCRVDHRSVTKRDRFVKCQVTSQDLVYLRYAKVLFVMFCHIFIPLQLLGVGNRGDGNLRLHRAGRAGARQ